MGTSKIKKHAGGDDDAQDSAAGETEKLYTLPELVTRLGEASDSEVDDYIEGHVKADLIEEGARVGTSRIDTDCARLYGKAADFFDQATEEQLDVLIGVSSDLLRVGVWAAHQGSGRAEARGRASAGAGAAKQLRATKAETVRDTAVTRRKSLRVGLRALAAGNSQLLTAIDSAVGTSATPKLLADSLTDLAKVGRKMLKNPPAALKTRLKKSRLTEAMLAGIEALAKEVRATGDAAGAVAAGSTVSQAEVDYWDGINLVLLGTLIDVFEAGHEADQTIPRLVPIALRSYFSPTRRARKTNPSQGEAPQPA